MVEVKKGLRNPLDEAQVRKAVVALQSFVDKQKAERAKQPLVEGAEALSCIITRKVVPGKASLKPVQIDVPHALYGGEAEMCLFVKDEDKKRIKEALAKDPVDGLTKVMTVKKLRKHFSRFEDKRTLAGAYDLFLADDRVLPYLKAPLGTKFFAKKKQPLAVRVSRKDVSFSIRAVAHRTAMHVSPGACSNVKVARLDMTVDQIVDNIMVAMNNCAAHIPKGWGGVQSISVKTNESIALPIYNALAPLAKLPSVSKAEALTKRKLEEVEAETAVKEEPAAVEEPAKKKAKKGKKQAPEPVVEDKKKAKKADKMKQEAEPVAEEPAKKKAKKEKKQVAEPVVEEKKKANKAKKTVSASKDAKPSPAKTPKAKHEQPVAKSPKEDKKAPPKKAKKAAAEPAEADAADKKKKKRKHAAKN